MTRRRKPEETKPYGIDPTAPRPPVGPRPRPLPDPLPHPLPEKQPKPPESKPTSTQPSLVSEIFDRATVKVFFPRPIRP